MSKEAVVNLKLSPRYLFSNILIPLGVLMVYVLVSSLLFPAGITWAFFVRLNKYIIPPTILVFIGFLIFVGLKKHKLDLSRAAGGKPIASDALLLLLPLAQVIQYILVNHAVLAGNETVLVVSFFVLLASIFIIIIPYLFRKFGSFQPVMAVGLAFVVFVVLMPSMSQQFSWHEVGRFKTLLMIFFGICFLSWLVFQLKWQPLLRVFAVLFLVVNSIYQLITLNMGQSASIAGRDQNPLLVMIGSRQPAVTPNIYLLVYDAYVSNETITGYGLDNHLQEQYLEDLGFKIYPHTYSLGSATLTSMSRLFNASADYYGNNKWRALAGDGVVQGLLEGMGYETYGIFPTDFQFRGYPPAYDHSFPAHSSSINLLINGILSGEFRFDLGFEDVSLEEYDFEKEEVFLADSEIPKFIYTQSEFPAHAQTSGVCLPNEVELFGRRLKRANKFMRQDIEMILKNDPDAILIVAGDHGPRITKNCLDTGDHYDISEISRLDIQDRFGSFLAIRWPTADFEDVDDIVVLQDLFPAIFAYIFQDPSLLNARVDPVILDVEWISGATVRDGIIVGGINDGESLFVGPNLP